MVLGRLFGMLMALLSCAISCRKHVLVFLPPLKGFIGIIFVTVVGVGFVIALRKALFMPSSLIRMLKVFGTTLPSMSS